MLNEMDAAQVSDFSSFSHVALFSDPKGFKRVSAAIFLWSINKIKDGNQNVIGNGLGY